MRIRDSLIGTVTGLWIGPHRNGRSNPGRGYNFPFLWSVHIVSGVQAGSYVMGNSGVKWPQGAADHPSLYSAEVNNMYVVRSSSKVS